MRGPSTQDCEKSYARTGVPSWNLQRKRKQAEEAAARIIPVVVTA